MPPVAAGEMPDAFPAYVTVDYSAGADETPATYPDLPAKIEQAVAVCRTALETYEHPAVMWTGGKDSTLTVYLLRETAREFDLPVPPAVFIDHFQHFDAIHPFLERWAARWGIELHIAQNADVGAYVAEHDLDPGAEIPIDALSAHNQHHVRELLEVEDASFPFLLDTYVGNHLLKTVALNDTLETEGFDGVISGVRWDEQAARAEETFFSPRHDPEIYPPHDRVHPILQFEETAVWDTFWQYLVPEAVPDYPAGRLPASVEDLPAGIAVEDLPVPPQYFEGFRSLGSAVSTERTAETPAWLQDMANTTERAGRAQDKEDLMGRLRDLGYM
jgi:sulfate adenylyltransferase subunit 2 (EC 2.7.7.4)